jgi:TrmH family RNA methyltransferase
MRLDFAGAFSIFALMMRTPESLLKQYMKLSQKKYRESEGKFIAEGIRLAHEALSSDWEVEALLVTPSARGKESLRGLLDLAARKDVPTREVSERDLGKISDTVTSQGVIAVVRSKRPVEIWNMLPEHALLVALDGVSDPGNVGTIMRTCAWFRADALVLGGASVEVFNPKVVRSAMGALFQLPVISGVDLPEFLRQAAGRGLEVIATVLRDGTDLRDFTFPEKSVIVFGSEARGISPAVLSCAHRSVTVPGFGKGESLNVAVSLGVLLAAYRMR